MSEKSLEKLKQLLKEAYDATFTHMDSVKRDKALHALGDFVFEESIFDGLRLWNRDAGYPVTVEA